MHTPGPWEYYERIHKEYPRGIRSRGGKSGEGPVHIASVRWGDDTGEANARLIASAPALLEALEAFRFWMLSGHNVNEVNGLMDQARAAIEAAKGDA